MGQNDRAPLPGKVLKEHSLSHNYLGMGEINGHTWMRQELLHHSGLRPGNVGACDTLIMEIYTTLILFGTGFDD